MKPSSIACNLGKGDYQFMRDGAGSESPNIFLNAWILDPGPGDVVDYYERALEKLVWPRIHWSTALLAECTCEIHAEAWTKWMLAFLFLTTLEVDLHTADRNGPVPVCWRSSDMIETELEVLEHQLNGLPASRPRARTVFSFATPLDLAIISISCFTAIVAGGLNPLLTASK